jgi:hypothetical protein
MLVSDALSLGLLAGGLAASISEKPTLAATLAIPGLAGYLAGGPVIHGVHRQTGRAFGSAALRLFGPILAGLLAVPFAEAVRGTPEEPECEPDAYDCSSGMTGYENLAVFGSAIVVSPVIAVAIDNLALAGPYAAKPKPGKSARRAARVSVRPSRDLEHRSATLQFSGVW